MNRKAKEEWGELNHVVGGEQNGSIGGAAMEIESQL